MSTPTLEQEKALQQMEDRNRNIFLTGKAGTGKSWTLRQFIQNRSEQNAPPLVVAPTGAAAQHIGGTTLHRAFGFRVQEINTPRDLRRLPGEKEKLLQQCETIVVDEISMVRVDWLRAMDWRLQQVRGVPQPFGGVQMIFCGDFCQLEPVATAGAVQDFLNQHFHGGVFAFEYAGWEGVDQIELQTSVRQGGDSESQVNFRRALDYLRDGLVEGLPTINQKVRTKRVDIPTEITVLCPRNTGTGGANDINRAQLNKQQGETFIFTAQKEGQCAGAYYDAEKNIPSPEVLELKRGALVLITVNQHADDPLYTNGTPGIVRDFGESEAEIWVRKGKDAQGDPKFVRETDMRPTVWVETLDSDGRPTGDVFPISVYQWEVREPVFYRESKRIEHKLRGTFTQIPLRLGYAISVHKSQGMSLSQLAFHPTRRRLFAHGQAYVAISRARSLDGLYLTRGLQPPDLIVREKVKNWRKYIQDHGRMPLPRDSWSPI